MTIEVYVTPRAKQLRIRQEPSGIWKIWVTAPPVDGKANEAVRAALADYFSVAKSSIRIVRGLTDRHKVIELPDTALPKQGKML